MAKRTQVRTPFTQHRAKTVQAKPKVQSKTACRKAAVRRALRED